ncbi:hypothetical protein KJ766_00895 [Patescibacteria group bacterium]|nr:hypothetical protein [Patescibacteria group bacterium]
MLYFVIAHPNPEATNGGKVADEQPLLRRFEGLFEGLSDSTVEKALRLINLYIKFPPEMTSVVEMLGENFIDPIRVMARVMNVMDIDYTDAQLAALVASLPDGEELEWCKRNDFVLVPGPPKSLTLACGKQPFRDDLVNPGWLMHAKNPVPNSAGKSWKEQLGLVDSPESIPNASELIWISWLHEAVKRIRLMEGVKLRTSSVSGTKRHIVVYNRNGVGTEKWSDTRKRPDLCITTIRRF